MQFAILLVVLSLFAFADCKAQEADMECDLSDWSKWRGLNKLNLFNYEHPQPNYDDGGLPPRESDFILIRKMGFNLMRVVVDYKYIYNAETESFNMQYIEWIDQFLEYGQKHRVHISINLHSAPGFSVIGNKDPFVLFHEEDIPNSGRPHFIRIWTFLAERYKDISNTFVDFNLLNEPDANVIHYYHSGEPAANYLSLLSETINAIREITPDRLIVLDVNSRRTFDLGLLDIESTENIILSAHCYFPWSVTHEGMNYQTQLPEGFTDGQITWPIKNYFNGFIYAPGKSRVMFGVPNTKAIFNHPAGFSEGTVSVTLVKQSGNNLLILLCDGVETGRLMIPVNTPVGAALTFEGNPVKAGTKKVEIIKNEGDWINVDRYVIAGNSVETTNIDWGYPPSEITIGTDTWSNAELVRNTMFPSSGGWYKPGTNEFKYPVRVGEMSSMARTAEEAAWRANLFRDFADAFHDMPFIFWEFKGGAMCIFNLHQTDVFTHSIDVEDSDGLITTYWYDKLWHDAIKHRLDLL